ncbi:adenine glycosylase [Collinsella tanakaei]|uniref:adenine glycosylase n=1 Tax=Collinsella tanakaei TaxID=626935 RepID=UPI003AB5412C
MNRDPFRTLVRAEGVRLYRDLPWRNTRDPYGIWISEVMLQQTQVPRVLARWGAWLDRFPSVQALAQAPVADVLEEWQGMGYNRRALALKGAAEAIVAEYDGEIPQDTRRLCALPGIGPATAQGIRSFAFDLPGVYLETNVRTVFLHHFFPDVPGVPDRELVPLIQAACPAGEDAAGDLFAIAQDENDTPRSWYYALLDYGAHLKKTVPNPSRRSSSYTRQSAFEGSRRQKRAHIVRTLLDASKCGGLLGIDEIAAGVNDMELKAGRPHVERELVASILDDLEREGFCVRRESGGLDEWTICS